MIRVIFFGVVKFYNIEVKPNDLRKDVLLNLMTNLILRKDVYAVVYSLLGKVHESKVRQMKAAMVSNLNISLEQLQISKYFTFDFEFKQEFINAMGDVQTQTKVVPRRFSVQQSETEMHSSNFAYCTKALKRI
jgi:hypothetical protein